MMDPKWREICSREFLLLSLGLFIVLALVESNKPHVVLRRPHELFTLTFYYGIFYLFLLVIRITYWAIKQLARGIISQYHKKATNKDATHIDGSRTLPSRSSWLRDFAHKGMRVLKPVYALHKIRSLF